MASDNELIMGVWGAKPLMGSRGEAPIRGSSPRS